jgi:hypothetical protein
MRRLVIHLVWAIGFTGIVFIGACTDRPQVNELNGIGSQLGNGALTKIAEIQYQGNDMQTSTMYQANGNLYLVGTPYVYMGMNISSSPENPTFLFAAAAMTDSFDPLGGFLADNFGSYSQTVFQQYGLLSGMAGVSVINLSNTSSPQEVERVPGIDSGGQNNAPAYVFKAMVNDPSLPIVYGFNQTSGAYQINMQTTSQQVPAMLETNFFPYSQSGAVCCVYSAALFQNDIYVGFQNQMWVYPVAQGGGLGTPKVNSQLQATNVQATAHAVYVQHQSTTASLGGSISPGIYVFEANGQVAGFLPVSPLLFAVDPTDTYLYTVEQDNSHVNIYSINWSLAAAGATSH